MTWFFIAESEWCILRPNFAHLRVSLELWFSFPSTETFSLSTFFIKSYITSLRGITFPEMFIKNRLDSSVQTHVYDETGSTFSLRDSPLSYVNFFREKKRQISKKFWSLIAGLKISTSQFEESFPWCEKNSELSVLFFFIRRINTTTVNSTVSFQQWNAIYIIEIKYRSRRILCKTGAHLKGTIHLRQTERQTDNRFVWVFLSMSSFVWFNTKETPSVKNWLLK